MNDEQLEKIDYNNEIWKPCPDFETKYMVSNYGRVKSIGVHPSCKTGGIISQCKKKSRNGYMQLRLYDNGRAKTVEVHTLVAKAFIPNPNNLPCVNHKDENKTNNKVENLEWCTVKYNVRYSEAKKVDVYNLQGVLIDSVDCITDASTKYNVPRTNISRSCRANLYTEVHRKYQFRFHGEPFISKPPKIIKPRKRKIHHGLHSKEFYYRQISQYSLDGNLLNTFSNLTKASKTLNIARSNIRKCCNGKLATIGGYIFLYTNDSHLSIEDKISAKDNRKHVSKTESKLENV